jgi:ParB family chromosome partitioning protein
VTALIWGPGDRLYSGSRDSTVKSWPRTGATRPATLKDGVGSVVTLAFVSIHNRPHLVAACDDNTLRFFLVDAAGKFGEAAHKVYDAYAWARHEFAQDESRGREAALRALAGFNDTAAIELLAAQVGADSDHGLRLLAAQLLGSSGHARAVKFLEEFLGHRDEAVRVAALEGLRRQRGPDNLEPLNLALQAAKVDIGCIAVEALQALAQCDDQALALLVQTLNAKTPEVRQAALAALEKVYDAGSAESNLVALYSNHADIRRLALIRLFQRRLLHAPHVAAALRRRAEDSDAEVRRAAFLVSLFGREKLVAALRGRDPELQRQLLELEAPDRTAPAEEKKAKRPKTMDRAPALEADDYDPLLQATASRMLDTCLRGARGLAVLGDARALGLLLQLSREEQPQARAEVCRALAALDDPRSIHRLRSLLHDPEAAVRDAAFTALANLHEADPLLVAEAGLGAGYEDVRRRGLQLLIGQIRKARSGGDGRAQALLIYALNDSFEGVRSEAFKAALNLQIHGGGPLTLRFVLRSVHADVRREVLTEVMAQANEPWAWQLLLEFFNDHDPALRTETFQFAINKTGELEPLAAALHAQYADIRKQAVAALVKRHSARRRNY